MIKFNATVKKFGTNGEKTGWTYLEIPQEIAQELNPNIKTSFRVKGMISNYLIKQIALLPMGEGSFIMPLNAEMRKGMRCKLNDNIGLEIEIDNSEFEICAELLTSFDFEPEALAFFNTLTKGHQRYFSNWIDAAKTQETKAKRIFMTITGLSQKMGYPEMIRFFKNKRG